MALAVRPGSGSTARFEVRQDALLPLVEAFSMHVFAGGAGFVVARDSGGFARVFGGDKFIGAQALAVGDAATQAADLHGELGCGA